MSEYPCPVGTKFKDKYNGEIATVIGFWKRGAGWQVRYTTPGLNNGLNFRCSWTQFKRGYTPAK